MAIVVTDTLGNVDDLAVRTHTVSIGTAAADRYVLVALQYFWNSADTTLPTVTLDGSPMEILVASERGLNTHPAIIAGIAKPTGTTAEVIITLPAAVTWIVFFTAAMTGVAHNLIDATAINSLVFPSATEVTLVLDTDVVTDGAVFGIGGGSVVDIPAIDSFVGINDDSFVGQIPPESNTQRAGILNSTTTETLSIDFIIGGGPSDVYSPAAAVVSFGTAASATPTQMETIKMAEISSRTQSKATVTSVAGSASSVALVAAKASRKRMYIQNTSTAILYVLLGGGTATATTAHSIQLASNAYVCIEGFTGAVSGIWAAANGQANITELE